MARHGALILAMLLVGAAAAACPPGGWCGEGPRPPHPQPPPAKPAIRPAPRPHIQRSAPVTRPARNVGWLPTVHVAPSIQPAPEEVEPAAPPARTPPATGPLFIHREEGGYTRHYGGAVGGVVTVGGQPSRERRGAPYHYRGRSFQPFFAGGYDWPHGRRYHRLHIRERLPRLFLIPEYYIDDYADYGFDAPPPGAQWVRYGPDLVLVDLDTGDILQVIPGVFADPGDPGAYVDENGAIPLGQAADEPPPPDEAASPN